MKKILICLIVIMTVFAINSVIFANETYRNVAINLQAISEFSVSGNPSGLTINSTMTGSEPYEVTNDSTTYNISTNGTNQKTTGVLSASLPGNVILKVNLTAPSGASSAGDVSLTTSSQNLVTGISGVGESGKTITYKFSATVNAGTVNATSITVTFTLSN